MRPAEADLVTLAEATFEALERTGVTVLEAVAAEALVAAGAERQGDRVLIPRRLVERALESAPRAFALHDADGRPAITLDGRHVYFGTGSDTPHVRDVATGERRRATLPDIANAARVCEALPGTDFVMSLGLASDAPTQTADLLHFEAMLNNTTKPILFTATSDEGLRSVVERCGKKGSDPLTERGQTPFFAQPRVALYAMPISPLVHPPEVTPMIRTCAEAGVPLIYASGVIAGATGPATLAGSLVVGAAECLSGLVLHQLARPGAPFIFGVVGSVMDMRTTVSAYGGAEFCLLNALATALGHHLGLPVFGTGGCTDSKVLDEQAAVEIAASLAAAHAAGTDLVHDIGYLESGQTGCLQAIVLADEIIRHLRRVEKGVQIDPERLALEVIDRVGPGGHFIEDKHTLAHFREEFLLDTRLDRQPFQAWQASGSPTLTDRLTAEVRRILGAT